MSFRTALKRDDPSTWITERVRAATTPTGADADVRLLRRLASDAEQKAERLASARKLYRYLQRLEP